VKGREREKMPRITQKPTKKEARRMQQRGNMTQMRKTAKYERECLAIARKEKEENDRVELVEKLKRDRKSAEELFRQMIVRRPEILGISKTQRESANLFDLKCGEVYDLSLFCETSGKEVGKCSGRLCLSFIEEEALGTVDDRSSITDNDYATFSMVKKYFPAREVFWPAECERIDTLCPSFSIRTQQKMQSFKNRAEKLPDLKKKFTLYLTVANIYPCKRFQAEKRQFVLVLNLVMKQPIIVMKEPININNYAAMIIAKEFYPDV
jgi:hypothetical protein